MSSNESEKRENPLNRRPYIIADRVTSGSAHRGIGTDDPVEGIIATGGCFLFFVFFVIVIFLISILPVVFTVLDKNIENKSLLGLIGAVSALTVGTSLYYLRKNKRMIYALMELAFAGATAWTAVSRVSTQGNLSVWLALGAAAYLVVRGIDNLQVAKEERLSLPRDTTKQPI